MKVNFKELKVEVSIGECLPIDVRKDLGNKLHRSAGDIETFDLGHRIYHSNGEIEVSESEYEALMNNLRQTGATIILIKALEKLKKIK